MTRARMEIIILAIMALALLSGCGVNMSQSIGESADISPMQEFWSAIYGTDLSPQERAQRANDENAWREQVVTQCMHDAGFTYLFVPPPESPIYYSEDWAPDSMEWVLQYGYGQVRTPPGWDTFGLESPPDPNQEYVNNLSDSERRAYSERLAHCQTQAWARFNETNPAGLRLSDEFAQLFEAWESLSDRLSDVSEADRAWSSCMADAGYPGFERQIDAQMSIADARSGLWHQLGDWDWVSNGPPTPDNHPAWAEMHAREVTLATIDLTCREQVSYREYQQVLRLQLEKQFVTDHIRELEALRTAAEQRG